MPETEELEIPDLDEGELPVPEPDDGELDIPDLPDEAAAAAPEPPAGTGNVLEDFLLGLGDGVSLNHGAELGRIGDSIGNFLADASMPQPVGKEVHGTRGVADELQDRASRTVSGKVGKGAGLVNTAALASMAAGPGVGGQVLAGGLTGAAATHGQVGHDSKDDLLAMLAGGGTGAVLGGVGGLAAKGLGALAAPSAQGGWRGVTAADDIAAQAGWKTATPSTFLKPWEWVLRTAAEAAPKVAKAAPLAPAVRAAGQAEAATGGTGLGAVANALSPSKASAQVAYGSEPTMSWAVQSILNSGSSQLDPQDEQQLTEAVMSGDADRVSSANFALQQKNPKYARRLQDELRSLQEAPE